MAKIMTRWKTFSYDFLGNKHDGYEVNNTYRGEEVDLALELKGYNQEVLRGSQLGQRSQAASSSQAFQIPFSLQHRIEMGNCSGSQTGSLMLANGAIWGSRLFYVTE